MHDDLRQMTSSSVLGVLNKADLCVCIQTRRSVQSGCRGVEDEHRVFCIQMGAE